MNIYQARTGITMDVSVILCEQIAFPVYKPRS